MVLQVVVLRVRGVEAHREAEGAALFASFQELERVVPGDVGEVSPGPVDLLLPEGLRVRAEEVEHHVRRVLLRLDAVLPDEAGPIPRSAEKGGVALRHELRGDGLRPERIAVSTLPGARQDRRAARGADRSRDEGVLEAHPRSGEPVDDRGLQHGVPRAAEGVAPLVIRDQEEEVRSLLTVCLRPAAHDRGEEDEGHEVTPWIRASSIERVSFNGAGGAWPARRTYEASRRATTRGRFLPVIRNRWTVRTIPGWVGARDGRRAPCRTRVPTGAAPPAPFPAWSRRSSWPG